MDGSLHQRLGTNKGVPKCTRSPPPNKSKHFEEAGIYRYMCMGMSMAVMPSDCMEISR